MTCYIISYDLVKERNYEELHRMGYYFKSTTISPILTQLVRRGRLFRLGKKGTYTYVKRP